MLPRLSYVHWVAFGHNSCALGFVLHGFGPPLVRPGLRHVLASCGGSPSPLELWFCALWPCCRCWGPCVSRPLDAPRPWLVVLCASLCFLAGCLMGIYVLEILLVVVVAVPFCSLCWAGAHLGLVGEFFSGDLPVYLSLLVIIEPLVRLGALTKKCSATSQPAREFPVV